LYYILVVAAVLAFYLKQHYKAILAAAVLPVLIVFAVFFKNFLLFGVFASSSWLGSNLCSVTTHQLTNDECHSLVAAGKLLPIGCMNSMDSVQSLRPFITPLRPTGIPVLDEEVKSTGSFNYNHQLYLKTGPLYAQAAKQVLHHYPIAYVRSVLIAWFCYFLPPTDFFQFEQNRTAIRSFDRGYNLVVFGQLRETSRKGLRALRGQGTTVSLALYTGLTLMIGLPLTIFLIMFLWLRWYHRRSEKPNYLFLLAYIVTQIVMIAVLTNFLASFENNRYRFPTDPLYVVLLGVLLTRLWRHFHRPALPLTPLSEAIGALATGPEICGDCVDK